MKMRLSRKNLVIVIVSILILGLGFFLFLRPSSSPKFDSIIIERGDLIQKVDVVGKVKPAQSVDLEFEQSGKVKSISVKVGDKVASGKVLATIDRRDLEAQLLEKEASLDLVKADLAQSVKNKRSLTDINTQTALRTELENAKLNLENIKLKAEDDLKSVYNDAQNIINESSTQTEISFSNYKIMQERYFGGYGSEDLLVQNGKNDIESKVYGSQAFNIKGSKYYVSVANSTVLNSDIDKALSSLQISLGSLRDNFSVLQSAINNNLSEVSSTDEDLVTSESSAITGQLSEVNSAVKTISTQKITNAKNISDAQTKLLTTQSSFPTDEDILKKESAVKQAEAGVLVARANLSKGVIVSPFSGIITAVNYDEGESAISNQPVVTMISNAGYEVEANVSEIEISKINIGDRAEVILDAYGPENKFMTYISEIDPAETVIDGITTYKIILQFENPDSQIRSNMTANIEVETARKDNVILIPQRALFIEDGEKKVRVFSNSNIQSRKVILGISGQDGMIEVVDGLSEGDNLITFIED